MATTSKFEPFSTSKSIPTYMPDVELKEAGTKPGPTGPVMVTPCPVAPVLGKETLPACPISCCKTSVALRTLVCICVLFEMLPCVFKDFTTPAITIAETASRIAIAIIVSSKVKPVCLVLFILFALFIS